VIFIAVFSDLVLWINGGAVNINYFLLAAMRRARNFAAAARQGRRHGAMPG
jgi:hypothetical protein